jgi:predicted nucleic acid-binding protein
MNRIVISDTSCLIILSKIDLLDILPSLFGEIWITEEVNKEFGEALPPWITVKKANAVQITKILALNVDKGEASAMALYLEQTEDALLVIDERKGRLIAKDLGIKIIGTLGIIVKAKQTGLIADMQKVIDLLEQTDFRLSPILKQQLLNS